MRAKEGKPQPVNIDDFLDQWATGDRGRRRAKRQEILQAAEVRIAQGLDTSVFQAQQSVLRRLRGRELRSLRFIDEPLVVSASTETGQNSSVASSRQTRTTTEQDRGVASLVPPAQSAALARQHADLLGLANERVRYSIRAAQNAREINREFRAGNISPEVAEARAVAARRQLESNTRANLPGPEPAGTLNSAAARRNTARYGDPLGFRDPAHLRQHALSRSPPTRPTTSGIIQSSGNPNIRVTASSVAGGALSVLGFLMMAMHAATELNGLIQVELEGLDPRDFDVGHEFHDVTLGDGWSGTIQVRENILGNKKFFIQIRTAYQTSLIASATPEAPSFPRRNRG